MEKVLVAAFQRYCVSNPLHPDVFPAVRKMEAEVVAMCLRMYNHPTGAGATTSGGTESILLSVKTHRDWARAVKGISEPEMHVLIRVIFVYCVLTIFCPGSSRRQFTLRLTKRPHISISNSIRSLCTPRRGK